MIDAIYKLWHFQIGRDDEEDTDDEAMSAKRIGFYTTEEKAKAAIGRLKGKPGFRDWPDGFRIYRALLDQDHWVGGFISWDDA